MTLPPEANPYSEPDEDALPPDLVEHLQKIASPANVAAYCSEGKWLPAWHLKVISRALVEAETDPEQSFLNLQVTVRGGKALDVDTPVPTPTGWTAMGDLKAGDEVYDEHGRVCRVVEAFEPYITDDAVEVQFNDGSSLVTDRPHKWTAYSYTESQTLGMHRRNHGQPHRAWPEDWGTQPETAHQRHSRSGVTLARTAKVRTTGEMMDDGGRFYIPVMDGALEAPEVDLPVDPYILGYWLGDGSTQSSEFTVAGVDLPHFRAQVEAAGYWVTSEKVKADTDNWSVWVTSSPKAHCKTDSLVVRLRNLGVLHNKHVPEVYLRAAPHQRLALLQGLMDSDGGNDRAGGKVSFTNQNPRLVDAVAELMMSLGTKVSRNQRAAKLNGVETGATAYRAATMCTFNPFLLPRKAAQWSDDSKGSLTRRTRVIVGFEPVGTRRVRCIAVDSPSHLYLAGEQMVPTHNSELTSKWNVVWYLGVFDAKRVLIVCATSDLAEKFSREARDLFKIWGPLLFGKKVRDDLSAADEWGTSDMGLVRAVGAESKGITGYGFDLIIIDDPISDAKAARSEVQKKNLLEWYAATLRTRLQPGGTMILVMARWTDDDLSGTVVEKAIKEGTGDPWKIIRISALAECPIHECPPLEAEEGESFTDEELEAHVEQWRQEWRDEWGREDGQSFWEEMWPAHVLERIREGLPDPTAWDALYQQNPVPQSGNKFERGHWKRENTSDLDIIDRFRAWDLASSENKGDYTVGALLGRTRDRRTVILDIIRGQWGPDRVEQEILDAADRDGMEVRIRMEIPKGESGVTLLHYGNLLHHRDFDGWNVKGKKEDRAQVMSGSHKKGKLIIPDNAPWAETLIAEFERFPYGTHDDQVDACALAFNQLWEYGGGDTMMTIPADAEAVMSLTAGFQPPEELVEYAGHLPAPWVELADQPG